jgi:alginate O-acetyltransferase complex protein AlgI
MSLGSWFRDYVYIPMGGNRVGKFRWTLNIFTVWMLTGLWHGASWNFVLWGLYYAVFLIVEKLFLLKTLERVPVLLRRCYTMLAVLIGWALFYFEDLGSLGGFLLRLFSLESTAVSGLNLISAYLPLLIVACLACTPVIRDSVIKAEDKSWVRWLRLLASAAALLLCIAALASESYNPFIYFRF